MCNSTNLKPDPVVRRVNFGQTVDSARSTRVPDAQTLHNVVTYILKLIKRAK